MSNEELQNERRFSFSSVRATVMNFVNQHLFRFDKKSINEQMQEPVNNYFKTAEQMEADFTIETNNTVEQFKEKTPQEIYLLTMSQTEIKDGYINIQDAVNLNSGYMEENY